MNKTKTEISYRVEYYDPQDKRWYCLGTYSQKTLAAYTDQFTAFNAFLRCKIDNCTCRMSKVEAKIEILEQYRRRPRKEGVSDESD